MIKCQLLLKKVLGLGSCTEVRYNNLQTESNLTIASRETNNYEIPVTTKLLQDFQELESCGISNTNLQVNQTLAGPKLSFGFKMDTLTYDSIEGYLSVKHLETFLGAFASDPGFLVKLELDVSLITVSKDPFYHKFYVGEVPYSGGGPPQEMLILTPDQERYCFKANITRSGGPRNSLRDLWHNNECTPHVFFSLALLFYPVDGVDPDQDVPDKMNYELTVQSTKRRKLETRPDRPTKVDPDPDVPDHLSVTKKMLSDGLLADVTIIVGNGAEVKCHRSVLAAHSPIFAAMFQPENAMTEAQTGILKMEHLSEDSVRGLLEYLYAWKSSVAHESPSVCVDLLEAGHQYDIKPLEKCMEKMLLRKTEDWFTGDSLLRLILYLKNRDLEQLKTRAMQLFELKYGDVKKLAAFQELQNTEAVAEVVKLISTARDAADADM